MTTNGRNPQTAARLARYAEAVRLVDEGKASPEVARVVKLLRSGLNGRQIAERLDLARSTVYQHLDDPRHEKTDVRRHRHRGVCEDCGRPTFNGGSPKNPLPKRCGSCDQTKNLERNERILELWEKGWTGEEIAAEVGLSYGQVRGVVQQVRDRMGLPVTLHRLRNREAWPTVERMWNEGAGVAEIALAVDSTPGSIKMMVRTMRRCGISLTARASASQVNESRHQLVVERWAEGCSMAEIAAELGITVTSLATSISRLRKRGYDLPYRRVRALNH